MGKFFLRLLFVILIIISFGIIYLSYFGLETSRFDTLIKNKANNVKENIKLDFQKTKIHLNLAKFNLIIKLQNPKVLVKNEEINLSKIDLFLSLKSFISSDFLLRKAEVAFIENDIKDLAKITNIFLPKIINKQLKKIFVKGNLEGEFFIPFKSDGSIDKDYGFSGKISDAKISITKELLIQNLTTEINYGKKVENNGLSILIKKGSIFNLELANSIINLKREKERTGIKSSLHTKGKLNLSQIKKISSLLGLNLIALKDINGTANLMTDLSFDLNKKFKVKNLLYTTSGNISYLEILTEEKKIVKEYLPDYDPKIIIKNTEINLVNTKSNRSVELNGLIKINDQFDQFKVNEKYNFDNKNFDITGTLDLTNSKVKISKLNYYKDNGKKSSLSFNVNFNLNKFFNIKDLKFINDKSKIYLSNIKLNKNYETVNFEKLEIQTFFNEVKNNDFVIKKSDKIVISGQIFDAQPLLKSLYKKSDRKTFDKSFKSDLKINFDKTLTGTNDDVSNFAMIASIKNGSYNKLSLKGNFSDKEIVEMSIYQVDEDRKTLQVISDRARPFVKNFDFIKGFEGGKLEYESFISKKSTESNLTITDFKVSKVPALAQLLTLASLQGIADTLSGEGIRFDSFGNEIKFRKKYFKYRGSFGIRTRSINFIRRIC